VRDVFPGVGFTSSGYEELTAALKESFDDLGLLCNENQVRNIYSILQEHVCPDSSGFKKNGT
jgi:hypothetical protein